MYKEALITLGILAIMWISWLCGFFLSATNGVTIAPMIIGSIIGIILFITFLLDF